MNRREFIAAAAVGLATTAAAQPRRITIGMLGASHSHAAEKLRILSDHPAFEFVGAVEESASVRDEKPGVKWISQDELFASAEVVAVESAVRDHARHALAALQAGKHLHLEKPPSAKWSEMQEIARLAETKNRLVQVGYMWRHNPGLIRIFEAVHQGWLGEIYLVRGMINNQLAARARVEWSESAGGAFFELAAHLVDVVVRLLGKPNGVTATLRSSQGDALMDNNLAVFEFDKALAVITNSTNQPNAFAHRHFEVFGDQGSMILRPIEQPALMVDLGKAAGPYSAGSSAVTFSKFERYRGEFDELAQSIQQRASLPVSIQEELLVHEWLLRSSGMFI